ncbi:MAG TPA: hypothetical protein VKA46_28850 [Gemmataceae bacterium]|nr:hypothetical protein [Gemmataceae bacterium]
MSVLVSSCHGLPALPGLDYGDNCPGPELHSCAQPSVMALAKDLDALEAHIERYGSVVAKQPDVWGQARMTRHRDEFEKQMAINVGKFSATLQGSLSRSDQAFFANAFALSAAISGPQAVLMPSAPVTVGSSTSTQNTTAHQGTTATAAAPATLPVPVAAPPSVSDFGSNTAVLARSTNTTAAGPGFGPLATAGIALEPTLQLDQEARYLNHLQHLRRINEGDDTADSPGYSLNLVRLPVSVLPGKCTDTGYGAEVTFTAAPYLGNELLPTTFRNLVINDLVDQLGLPLTQVLNDKELVALCLKDEQVIQEIRCQVQAECLAEGLHPAVLVPVPQVPPPAGPQPAVPPDTVRANATAARQRMKDRITIPTIPATKNRRARLPFPPSQMFEIYGLEPLFNVAQEAHAAFQRDPANRPFIHYPDVQGYLQEELAAAYKFLASPASAELWNFCNPELVTAIRSRQDHQIKSQRCQFFAAVQQLTNPGHKLDPYVPVDVAHSAAAAFAWAIVVESALLTDQLVQDMRETAAAKGCPCAPEGWLDYYLPDPSPEARHAFTDYVRCRWPIHVFALDPMTEDQNIEDAFALRRELQLAMSLAFVSGQLSASHMTRFARRLEQDYETIALNRTIVGFSHAEDTFGWRFYPRFQTPDVESGLTVCCRDLFLGGPRRDALLCQRRLEPGPRDCAAVVIMPSFVPYVTLESSANWFKLTNPKCKELTAADAMRLSRAVKSIQECGPHVRDADCYRGGDLALLLRKAEQLSQRLPFQTQVVQVPYENTLGGFAMFNTGVTDLAPQLNGWYGAQGIDVNNGNAIFLVGDHFSVLSTRVLVGGRLIDPQNGQELLSRQVIKVSVPAGAQVLHDPNGDFVDVHLATPYGVTQHLLVPVCSQSGPPMKPAQPESAAAPAPPADKTAKPNGTPDAAAAAAAAPQTAKAPAVAATNALPGPQPSPGDKGSPKR